MGAVNMRLEYHRGTDSMYVYMQAEKSQGTRGLVKKTWEENGVRLEFMAEGELIGIEIKNASRMIDLEYLRKLGSGPAGDGEGDVYVYMQAEKLQNIMGVVKKTSGIWPIQLDFMVDGRLFGMEILDADKVVGRQYLKKLEFIEKD